MCLAVPGKIVDITDEDPLTRRGNVDFSGVVKEVGLCFVPDAKPGDYVLVHVGFALNTIDEEEARKVFEYLREMNELSNTEEREP